jgi:hypothetical protein
MTDILRRVITGFTSTFSFFVVFIIAGDVLLAAGVASAIAMVQFVFATSPQGRAGAIGWTASLASLAVVVALTATTLAGSSPAPSSWSPAALTNTALTGACIRTLPI